MGEKVRSSSSVRHDIRNNLPGNTRSRTRNYPLPTALYPLLTTHYPLLTAHYPLPTTHLSYATPCGQYSCPAPLPATPEPRKFAERALLVPSNCTIFTCGGEGQGVKEVRSEEGRGYEE